MDRRGEASGLGPLAGRRPAWRHSTDCGCGATSDMRMLRSSGAGDSVRKRAMNEVAQLSFLYCKVTTTEISQDWVAIFCCFFIIF